MTRFCKCSLQFRFTDTIILCTHVSLHVDMEETCHEYLLLLDQYNNPGISEKATDYKTSLLYNIQQP
jgi:hypothetical protein